VGHLERGRGFHFAAVLVHRAMGTRLTNIFVNTGMLRKKSLKDARDAARPG